MGFIDPKTYSRLPVSHLVGALASGATVRSEVHDPEQSEAAGPVYLTEGDQECGRCGEAITAEDYPGASWVNVLARQRLQYGDTYCADCHAEVAGDG